MELAEAVQQPLLEPRSGALRGTRKASLQHGDGDELDEVAERRALKARGQRRDGSSCLF